MSNIDIVELSAWLNHQECRKLLELRKELLDLATRHQDLESHRTMWNLFYAISWRVWEYKPSDWRIILNQEWLRRALLQFGHFWGKCSPNSRVTYYSHIVCDHLLAIIIFLADMNLTIIDVMSQGLENAHCMSNRLLKWKGTGRFLLHNGKRCLMPCSNNKQEMLKWWTPILRKLYPNEYTPSTLCFNQQIKEFWEISKNENCVPLADKCVPSCERPDFTEWGTTMEIPVEPVFQAKLSTLSRRTRQKHQARNFKDFMWQKSRKIFKKRRQEEDHTKRKKLKKD